MTNSYYHKQGLNINDTPSVSTKFNAPVEVIGENNIRSRNRVKINKCNNKKDRCKTKGDIGKN